ncbi:MAG: 30S ribosomal protein S16 [Planctomycetota bacterium]
MAVRIRFSRTGRRNQPYMRLGAFDSRTKRDGKPLEILGNIDLHGKTLEEKYRFNAERIRHWLSLGALASENVQVVLKKLKIEKPAKA